MGKDPAAVQAEIHASYGMRPDQCRLCGTVHDGEPNSLCGPCDEKTSRPPAHAGTRRVPDGHGCTERLPTFVDDNPYEVF